MAVSWLWFYLCFQVASARAGQSDLYVRAVELVRDRYLHAARFDGDRAFERAAEAAEAAVPWLLVRREGDEIVLKHGDAGAIAHLDAHPADLAAALDRLEDAIEAQGSPLPAGLDLPVELLRGMSRALDPHSVVLVGTRLGRFDERIEGRRTGVGARIAMRNGRPVVDDVFPDTPASRGGLEAGDVIEAVDGVSTAGMDLDQVTERIGGRPGSTVVLTIRRKGADGASTRKDLKLVRAEVVIPVVAHELLPSGIGHVSIDHFSEHAHSQMRAALADLEARGASGIILDLRGNAGGSMLQACRIADLFLDHGRVVRTAGADGQRVDNLLATYDAHPDGVEPRLPLVVLVDRESASAAEILAGSLRLLGRAVLIGDRTHGKGSVQQLFTIREDPQVKMKLTVARFLLAGNTPITPSHGIAPDLWAMPVRFHGEGVDLPDLRATSRAGIRPLLYVEQATGGRPRSDRTFRRDFLVDLADRVIRSAIDADGSGAVERGSLLRAIERVQASARKEELERLIRAFDDRGIDWRGADEAGGEPDVTVAVSLGAPPRAGAETEVRVQITNHGWAPLYRTWVRLNSANRHLPWDGLTVPVGFVPPGETSSGSAVVAIPPDAIDREDRVEVTVFADKRPEVTAAPVLLRTVSRLAPVISLEARLVRKVTPHVDLTLTNPGEVALTGVSTEFTAAEGAGIEIRERNNGALTLAAHSEVRISVPVKVAARGRGAAHLHVEVRARGYGEVLSAPLSLPLDGSVATVSPPTLSASVPLTAAVGATTVRVHARDDRRLLSIEGWWAGRQIAWHAISGKEAVVPLPIHVDRGTHELVVTVRDDQGVAVRRAWGIRGTEQTGAADAGR